MYKPTLEENLAATIAGDYRLSGEDMMADALEWKQDNPEAWHEIEEQVRECVRTGRKASLRVIVDGVVWHRGIKCRHALTAPFQRILAQRIPRYRECFDMSSSKVDGHE